MTPEQLARRCPTANGWPQAGDEGQEPAASATPTTVSPTSAWGRFLATLVTRYSARQPRRPNVDAVIDVARGLQRAQPAVVAPAGARAPTRPTRSRARHGSRRTTSVARMFVDRQGRSRRATAASRCWRARAASDTTDRDRLQDRVLQLHCDAAAARARGASGFVAGAGVRCSRTTTTPTSPTTRAPVRPRPTRRPTRRAPTNRAADTRRRLVGQWAGWPDGNAANPGLWLTEGGVTLAEPGRQLGHRRHRRPARQGGRPACAATGTGCTTAPRGRGSR